MPDQKTEFQSKAFAVADVMVNAIEGEHDAFVLLEAALIVHRFVMSKLPANLKHIGLAGASTYVEDQLSRQLADADVTAAIHKSH